MTEINLTLEASCIVISLMLVVFLSLEQDKGDRQSRLFLILLILNTVVLMCDAVTWIFSGNPENNILLSVSNFFVYSLGYVMMAVFTDYLFAYLDSRGETSPRHQAIIAFFCGVAVFLAVLSFFNGMFFYYDKHGEYIRGDSYWLSQAYPALLLLIDMGMVIKRRKKLGAWDTVCLLSYVILPITAAVLQIAFFSITLVYVATTLSLLIIYITVQMAYKRKLIEKENELTQSRVSSMLSQIKPHFLYNTLSGIKVLCDENPKKASEALEHFSFYLRGNLDSINASGLIPFEKELEHVNNYLFLEKMRFEERLSIVYNIQVRDFFLPVLTLQPLVENSIKHGVTVRKEGGTITITTGRDGAGIYIEVADDGVGFDIHKKINDGRSHIGIENVRKRLESQCGGNLSVNSSQSGTIVTIRLT